MVTIAPMPINTDWMLATATPVASLNVRTVHGNSRTTSVFLGAAVFLPVRVNVLCMRRLRVSRCALFCMSSRRLRCFCLSARAVAIPARPASSLRHFFLSFPLPWPRWSVAGSFGGSISSRTVLIKSVGVRCFRGACFPVAFLIASVRRTSGF